MEWVHCTQSEIHNRDTGPTDEISMCVFLHFLYIFVCVCQSITLPKDSGMLGVVVVLFGGCGR